MKSLFGVSFEEKTIIATKTTLKKASTPNSPEYKMLMKLMKQHPTYSVVQKDVKKSNNKKTYSGLTNELMEAYISIQTENKALMTQFEKANEIGNFPLIRKWFLKTFEGFDVDEAKEEIAASRINAISASEAA